MKRLLKLFRKREHLLIHFGLVIDLAYASKLLSKVNGP